MPKYTFRISDEQIIYVIEDSRFEEIIDEEKTIHIILKINNRFLDKFTKKPDRKPLDSSMGKNVGQLNLT